MKLGIVGANSQVGTELCCLFRANGYDVVPIVRNERGGAFLSHQGFDVRFADIHRPDAAREALVDVDVACVAAYAAHDRTVNKQIVDNTFEYTPNDATVVYFSSIAALGDRRYGARTFGPLTANQYTRVKRYIEGVVADAASRTETAGYALRLGHVVGCNQDMNVRFLGPIEDGHKSNVAADPDAPSNVVHTVALCDGILTCHEDTVESGTYTLVDTPQWTWADVFSYYATDCEYTFVGRQAGSGDRSLRDRLGQRAWQAAKSHSDLGNVVRQYFPESVDTKIDLKNKLVAVEEELGEYESRFVHTVRMFDYEPVPGPHLPGTTETRSLLASWDIPEDLFEPNG